MSKRCDRWAEDDLGAVIEHIRKKHGYHATIKRYGKVVEIDGHGHMWYFFQCERHSSDHKSFDSHQAFWDHLHCCRAFLFEDIKREDDVNVL
jgi:hypothetical protein